VRPARVARWLVGAAALAVAGCALPSGGDAPVPAGATRGELTVTVATLADGSSKTEYFLRPPELSGAAWHRLLFDRTPDLGSGVILDVWGQVEGDAIRVQRFAPAGRSAAREAPAATGALRAGSPLPTRRVAFVLIDTGAGVGITATQALAALTGLGAGNPVSLREYYYEASYGQQDISAQVFGPLSYTAPVSCAISELDAMVTALLPQVTGTFDHYIWYFGNRINACAFSGLAAEGRANLPQRNVWLNASTGCVVLAQELGHNLGLQHSSSLSCPTMVTLLDATETCVHSEFGDSTDVMGGGCNHMNGYHKAYSGWMGGCNLVRARSSGTFNLVPLELPCDGVQVLEVPMPKTRTITLTPGTATVNQYYVELRTARGIDGALAGGVPVVQIRASADVAPPTQTGAHTWLLDMAPGGTTFEGLTVGQSFSDPAGGVTIRVDALDANGATVTVTLAIAGGASLCLDGTSFQNPGPDLAASCAAAPAVPGGATGLGGAIAGTGGRTGTGGVGVGGATGAGGTVGGTGGRIGTGGVTGAGGAAGGFAGRSGAGGMAGASGGAGAAGTGGRTGTAGTSGSVGGATGAGGVRDGGGQADAGSGGLGGAPEGRSGSGGAGPKGHGLYAGSACALAGDPGRGDPLFLALLPLLGAWWLARRRALRHRA
jgi:hypothetical protein